MNNQTVKRIVSRFGIRASGIKELRRGTYRIETSGGSTYNLKRMPMPIARLQWTDRMLRHVRKRGGPHLAWRHLKTPEGTKLYALSPNGAPYVLTPWISGRHPSPQWLSEMRACGFTLARLHVAGQNAIRDKHACSEIGRWFPKLRKRERLLRRRIQQARLGALNPAVNRFLQLHSEELSSYAKQSISMLRKSAYRQLRMQARRYGVLCHGDGGPSNFILNARGTYLIDFETLHIDLAAYDLYRVIYNSCKDHEWDFAIAEAILDGYRQVGRLTKSDYALIRAWIRFPHTTYYVLLPSDRFPSAESGLQWALKSERQIGPFLQKLKNYAGRHG